MKIYSAKEFIRASGMVEILCQNWIESERGWGRNPDGFSLHGDDGSLNQFVSNYWERQYEQPAPDVYSRPDALPYTVFVAKNIADLVKSSKGIRFYADYPGPDSVLELSYQEIISRQIK